MRAFALVHFAKAHFVSIQLLCLERIQTLHFLVPAKSCSFPFDALPQLRDLELRLGASADS